MLLLSRTSRAQCIQASRQHAATYHGQVYRYFTRVSNTSEFLVNVYKVMHKAQQAAYAGRAARLVSIRVCLSPCMIIRASMIPIHVLNVVLTMFTITLIFKPDP